MKAAWFEQFGSAEDVLQVGELDKPEPAAGEVRVRLATSGVNPSDVKKRMGSMPGLLDQGLVIPHSDGAGTIDAVGEGVDKERLGERVWVYQAQHGRQLGTSAEYVCLPANRAATLPDNVSFSVGACIGIPVMTAHRCVLADGPVAGQTLLITGGAGRVGHYAIQWATLAGARVIATASQDDDREACLEAGAEAVVNHRDENWGQDVARLTEGRKVDRVIDVEFGANLNQVLECIRTSGTIVTYGSAQEMEPKLPFYRMMFMDLKIRMVIVYDMPEVAKQLAIKDIHRCLSNGDLQHRIAHEIGLEDIAKAHELIEQGGFRGAVVVRT